MACFPADGPRGDGRLDEDRAVAGLIVRPASFEDVEAIAAVQEAAGRQAHREGWRRAIADEDRLLLVAEEHELRLIVGWAQTYHHREPRDEAPAGHYLGGVTVHPDHRRRGVAVALTDTRLSWLAERTSEAFYVVNPSNRASIDLHERWGFAEVLRAPRLTGVTFSGGVGTLMRADLR
ncbi:GNAT family N-acetyltransferase [Pseudactinotalea sp.]|uniref:GNAT family N-acetyltransferase n=1 Tax=Pseudactinotalea sp. TaxID=1926260 RepID=UPI003B3AFD0D